MTNNNLNRSKIKSTTELQWVWFRTKIKAMRIQKGLTQTDLADKLGITKSRISHLEIRETDITFSLAMRLIMAFDMDAAEFFADCPGFFRLSTTDKDDDLEVRAAALRSD